MTKMKIGDRIFDWGSKTYLMGVINVTPDSFSDGGQFYELTDALTQAEYAIETGADILDIGGQSTRPGAEEVSLEEELNRVLPIIKSIRQKYSVPISIDTTKAEVAKAAVAAGADIVNDISGATFDLEMLPAVAQLGVPIVLMHLRGTPQTMQKMTDYQDLIGEIYQFLESRIAAAETAGIHRDKIIIDPGIGFAKNYRQNLDILRQLTKFSVLQCPILVGVSRKSFIGHILNQPDPKQRIWGTGAACCAAISFGADILRVHDIKEMADVCRVADAIYREK